MTTPTALTPAELRAWRERLGLSQSGLAKALGYTSVSTVQHWEQGINPVPAVVSLALESLERRGGIMARQQQVIEQVAGIILGHLEERAYPPDPAYTYADAERTNGDTGWTFDVRWQPASENYVTTESWTRVKGAHLIDSDLRAAWALAEQWAAGDFGPVKIGRLTS